MLTTIRERREFSIPFVKELGRKWIFYSGCKPNQPALISCPIMEQLPSSEVLRVIMCVYLLFLCRVCVQVKVLSLLKLLCYTFLTFPACFKIPIFFSNLNSNFFSLLDMRNLQEQVQKAFCYQKLFWPFTVWTNCSSDLKFAMILDFFFSNTTTYNFFSQ